MPEPASSFADKIDRAVQRVTPFAYRLRRRGRLWMRRAMRRPRSVAEGPNLLPVLIQVLASFSKADGVLLEEQLVLLDRLLERCPNARAVTYEDPVVDARGELEARAHPSLVRLQARMHSRAMGLAS